MLDSIMRLVIFLEIKKKHKQSQIREILREVNNGSYSIERKEMSLSRIRRYTNLTHEIVKTGTTNIIELGVCNGINAELMIRAAQKYNICCEPASIYSKNVIDQPWDITYYGFDLFEAEIDSIVGEDIPVEGLWAAPLSVSDIRKKLEKTEADIRLFPGSTFDTLPLFVSHFRNRKFDFIFIDAGHSFEAQRNDWHYVQKLMNNDTVVLIDDYLEKGHIEGGKEWGVTAAVNEIDRDLYKVEVLEPKDVLPLPEDTTCTEPYISYDENDPATNAIVKVTRKGLLI